MTSPAAFKEALVFWSKNRINGKELERSLEAFWAFSYDPTSFYDPAWQRYQFFL